MAVIRPQQILSTTCLVFIGIIILSCAFPKSNLNFENRSESQLSNPNVALLGTTPFEQIQLLNDSTFSPDASHWNFTNSTGITALWNDSYPLNYFAQFNHSSPETGPLTFLELRNAWYGVKIVKGLLFASDDDKLLSITSDSRSILNVEFSSNLTNGDILSLKFWPGNPASIYVRDEDSQLPPIYGTGYYAGDGFKEVNITLRDLSGNKTTFNLDVIVPLGTASLDQVSAYYRPGIKFFNQTASINQTFVSPGNYTAGYSLNATGVVNSFQNVQHAHLAIRINNTIIWSRNLTGVTDITQMDISIPHGLLQKGGNFAIFFEVNLRVHTGAAVEFKLLLDNIYLFQTPNLNLLDDSEFFLGSPYWNATARGLSYTATYDPSFHLYRFNYNSTEIEAGGANLTQTFTRNSSQSDFQLVINFRTFTMTGIDHVNLTAFMNGTKVGTNLTINSTSSNWQQLRINATPGMPVKEDGTIYVLNISLDVKVSSGVFTVKTWNMVLDNISLFALWESNLTQIGDYDGNVTAGLAKDVRYQYNSSLTQQPIRDAIVKVYNNDTGIEWGLDLFGTRKYLVTNFFNGIYNVSISTVGFTGGDYNLAVEFVRPNFPDTRDYLKLTITGNELNITVSSGANFNNTHKIWWVDTENIPYVDDDSKKITLFVRNNITFQPIENAIVEAEMGPNILTWFEIFDRTFNDADKGYYEVVMNTTGITNQSEYLSFNFSIRVTAQNHSASIVLITTKINQLPSTLIVQEIPPFYQGSTLDIDVIFHDTFHDKSINYANLNWSIYGTNLNGTLYFIFFGPYGFYRSQLPLENLPSNNYTLHLTGQKENYVTSTFDLILNIMPKWNVSFLVSFPETLMEGNSYQISYSFTYTELGGPLVGESIAFHVRYNSTGREENYVLFSSDTGLITITLVVPLGENEVTITATYAGKSNVSATTDSRKITVIGRYAVNLEILPSNIPAELVGETDLEITARLTYTNGTPIEGALLVFRVGTSEFSVLTDAAGIARALVKLPTEGTFTINVTYAGTSITQSESIGGAQLTIISQTTATVRQIIYYIIAGAIIAAIAIGTYIGLDRGVVRPRRRARQAEYVSSMNRFEDARNLQILIIINRESGTEIFSKSLSGVPVDPTLVSGFLQAITSFGKELISEETISTLKGPKSFLGKTKSKHEAQVLAFHHFKIVLEESAHLRVALLLLKNPSQRLLNALHKFLDRAETRFGGSIVDLRGRQLTDDETWEIIDDAFEPSLIYIHMLDIVNARSITPTKWEKVVLDEMQRTPFYGEAYLDSLQDEIASHYIGKELEIVDAGLSLRRKNILLALSPKYMEARLTIRKAIDALPVAAKGVILAIGDGEEDPVKIAAKANLTEAEYSSIVQQLQELSIVTEKYKLDMPGKLVYTTLKCGVPVLKQ